MSFPYAPSQFPMTPPSSQPHSRPRAVQTPLQLLKRAISRGCLLDWTNSYLQTPRDFLWPADANGRPVPASQLNAAFQLYDIPIPKCPCGAIDAPPNATPDPQHFKIWIVKTLSSRYHNHVAMACQVYTNGCGAWMSLSNFETSRNLQVYAYPLRAIPGPSLPDFDLRNINPGRAGAMESPLPPPPPPANPQPSLFTVPPPPPGAFLPNNPFLVAPPPYQISSPSPTQPLPHSHASPMAPSFTLDLLQETLFANHRPAISQATIHRVPSPTPSNTPEPPQNFSRGVSVPPSSVPSSPMPPPHFLQPSRKSGFAIASNKRIGSSPQLSQSPSRKDVSASPVNYPSSPVLTRKRSHWSSNVLSSPTPSSVELAGSGSDSEYSEKMLVERLKRELDLPSQRWFGELNQLFEPPDIEYALMCNSEVPPLEDNEFNLAWQHLNSTKGINSTQFWQMFDLCDCGAYFQKAMIGKHRQFGCPASLPVPSSFDVSSSTPSTPNSSHVVPSGLSLTRPMTSTDSPSAGTNTPPELGTNDEDLYV